MGTLRRGAPVGRPRVVVGGRTSPALALTRLPLPGSRPYRFRATPIANGRADHVNRERDRAKPGEGDGQRDAMKARAPSPRARLCRSRTEIDLREIEQDALKVRRRFEFVIWLPAGVHGDDGRSVIAESIAQERQAEVAAVFDFEPVPIVVE